MSAIKGINQQDEISALRRRRDTRRFGQKFSDFFQTEGGISAGLLGLVVAAIVTVKVPFSGEVVFLVAIAYGRWMLHSKKSFDFPFRLPKHANVFDGSYRKQKNTKTGRHEGQQAAGISYLGFEASARLPIYVTDSDQRTHFCVLGTTGSGKTEFLLALGFNALIQNTGFLYVDGKGDPKLYKEIFRLARSLGREDDLLIINFITSGRDFIDAQPDKMTNSLNVMGNVSAGMLIEMIVSLLDDAGASGEMWKGRAISFVAALTRPLIFLRDQGHLNLSPEVFLDHFSLEKLTTLVYDSGQKYGPSFELVVSPLKSYLETLPGFKTAPEQRKKQDQKTSEQHGFIVMQLTRVFNDFTFNYGHIFRTKVSDVDFFDVVVNRRILVVLLPALERAPDSLRMLGRIIVGSVKQMMAGCLGNRVEGMVREIIDSRPTNSEVPFYCIFDEYGYYAVAGFAVAPAQARSLGFSIAFGAQDFSALKKSSAEEADSTWENTNIRVIGRLTSGEESETWRRVVGAAGKTALAQSSGYDRKAGDLADRWLPHDHVSIEYRSRLDYDDLAAQENGEFHFILGKKEDAGRKGGVRVVRGMAFYTAGPAPKALRLNDLIPVEPIQEHELVEQNKAANALVEAMASGQLAQTLEKLTPSHTLLRAWGDALARAEHKTKQNQLQKRLQVTFAAAQMLDDQPVLGGAMPVLEEKPLPAHLEQTFAKICEITMSSVFNANPSPYTSAQMLDAEEEVSIASTDLHASTDFISSTELDMSVFAEIALPMLQEHLQDTDDDDEDGLDVADRERLLDMSMMVHGPFQSLADKWAAEEEIDDTRSQLAEQTKYPPETTPEMIDVPQIHLMLEQFTNHLKNIEVRA